MKDNEILFDKRVTGMFVRDRTITPAEYEKHKKSLPDLAKEAEWTDVLEIAPRSYLASVLQEEPDDEETPDKEGK